MRFFKKPFVYAVLFASVLVAFTTYVLLDTFVIARAISAERSTVLASTTSPTSATAVVTEQSYSDENISVKIETIRENNTDIYIADIQISSAAYLKTMLAHDSFGTNITETTSDMAQRAGAILAINGDFYGANKRGYVIKNGVLYRSSIRGNTEYDDMVIYQDGSAGFVNENAVTAQALVEQGVTQLFAFGPVLLDNGKIMVGETEEVGKAMNSNPRTAIGVIAPLHYIFIVSDGRTEKSTCLTMFELAELMAGYGCVSAYNLD